MISPCDFQEQPLLLEDLLEQEKREQARHVGTGQMDQIMPNQVQQSMLNDQVKIFNYHAMTFFVEIYDFLGLREASG